MKPLAFLACYSVIATVFAGVAAAQFHEVQLQVLESYLDRSPAICKIDPNYCK